MRSKTVWLFLIVSIIYLVPLKSSGELLKSGNRAPSFSLPRLKGKRSVLNVWCGESLRKPYINDKKHTVILSFWATYCAPCMKEIPKLMKF